MNRVIPAILASPLPVIIGDGTETAVVDEHGALVAIDQTHHEVHEGHHFTWTHIDTEVDTDTPLYVRITTPDTDVEPHLTGSVDVGVSGGTVEFFEAPTLNAPGTAGTPLNNNRRSLNLPTCTVFYDCTTTNDGTRLMAHLVGSTGGGSRFGGSVEQRTEWILARNTTYILKVTTTADNTRVALALRWYEE